MHQHVIYIHFKTNNLYLFFVDLGKEVAKFVNLKYADVLRSLESFQKGDYPLALRESFHKIDELLEDMQYDTLLKELKVIPNPSNLRYQKPNPKPASSLSINSQTTVTEHQSSSVLNTMEETLVSTPSNDEVTLDEEEGAEDKLLSTTEAIRLIRELLHGTKKPHGLQAKSSSQSNGVQAGMGGESYSKHAAEQ
jgi:hypothetical protein